MSEIGNNNKPTTAAADLKVRCIRPKFWATLCKFGYQI